MKNASHWVRFVLVLALACISLPAVRAETADDFWNKAGLSDVKDELALFGARLDKVQAVGNTWSADGGIFGLSSVKFYVYQASASPMPLPVLAIPLPVNLTVGTLTNYLFDSDGSLNLGLNQPIIFWAPKDAVLRRTEMPEEVRKQAVNAGLPDNMRLAKGFNLFGRVSGGFLDYLTKLGLPSPNNLTVGVARRKTTEKDKATQQERHFKIVSASVGLSAGTEWSRPYGLNMSIRGATLRSTTKTNQETKEKLKTNEMWGRLSIKGKDYVAYVERDTLGLKETLAFDTKAASLQNLFDIAEVFLPGIPFPSGLPLDKVAFSNPSYDDKADAASPPDFGTMMFAGTRDNVQPQNSMLVVHAGTTIFGWDALQTDIKASKSGVEGAADLRLARIGPIEATSASFYLAVTASRQAMGISIKNAPVYGTLDLQAGKDGLQLHIPASCPLRPVGLKAVLSNLPLTDFPVSPELKDCFSDTVKKIAAGTLEVGEQALGAGTTVATDAVTTATSLGTAAEGKLNELTGQRVDAWKKGLIEHAAEVKAAKGALDAANIAFKEAQDALDALVQPLATATTAVNDAEREIKKLLKKLWALVSGDVKAWEKVKAAAIGLRDSLLTQQASADARKRTASRDQEDAKKGLEGIAGPNLRGDVATLDQQLLGQLAQKDVQQRVVDYATQLQGDLKDKAKTRTILASAFTTDDPKKDPLADFEAERATAFSTAYATASAALTQQAQEGFFADSQQALVAQAVAKAIENETSKALKETVPTLPTMAFGVPVIIKEQDGTNCFTFPMNQEMIFANCDAFSGRDRILQKVVFRAGGRLEIRSQCVNIVESSGSLLQVNCSAPQQTLFFYDPVDGVIRYLPENATTPKCLANLANTLAADCSTLPPKKGPGHWTLLPADGVARRATTPTALRQTGVRATGRTAAPVQRTNLAPLRLLPTGN